MQQTPQNPGQDTGQNSSAGATIAADAKNLGSKAADRIHSEVDSRKGAAVGQVQSFSSAIEKTAGELNDGPEWLKSALQKGAQQIQQFAESIEQKDSRQLMNDVQTFARDNPGTFLAACAAAGFAAARVLKAGSGQGQTGSQEQGQWDPSVEVNTPAGASPQASPINTPGEYV